MPHSGQSLTSTCTGHYAISAVTYDKTLDHMLILPSWVSAIQCCTARALTIRQAPKESNAPGQTQYRLGTMSKTVFNTVPKMIAYYIGTSLFLNPSPEQVQGIPTLTIRDWWERSSRNPRRVATFCSPRTKRNVHGSGYVESMVNVQWSEPRHGHHYVIKLNDISSFTVCRLGVN